MDWESLLLLNVGGLTLEKALWAILLAAVLVLAVKILLKMLDRMFVRLKVDPTLLGILRAMVKVLLLFVAALILLGYLNIPVTSLVAVLSVVGLAISLSVQNFLSNVAGGFQLLASHPFKVGDYVEAGGCAGTVQEIGMFYTKLRTVDNKLVQLPNSSVVAATITNYSSEELRRVDLTVSASYDAPLEQVKHCLRGVVERHPKTLQDPVPLIRVNEYGASAIEYVVRVWCRNEDYWEVYFDLMEDIKAGFDRERIEMTYPHLNIHVLDK